MAACGVAVNWQTRHRKRGNTVLARWPLDPTRVIVYDSVMPAHIELLDAVALTMDVPAIGLTAGEVGAVVKIHGDGDEFEVEFCDSSGTMYEIHTLRAEQLMPLHARGHTLRFRVGAI